MKRKEKIIIALFSSLLLLSFVNTSSAIPASYVGVATGDEYKWVPSINMANINATGIALIGQENWTIAYSMLMEMYENATGISTAFFEGAGIKAVLTNVSDEMTLAPGIFVTPVYMDIYISQGNNNWTMVANNTVSGLFHPDSLNETTIISAFGGIPFFMSKGFNYTMAASALSTVIASNPYTAGNITIQGQGNGYKITLLSTYLEASVNWSSVPFNITLGNVVFNVRWNSNGVFEYGEVVYGGLTLASIQLTTSDSIPGFEIVTIIGVSIVTTLAIIYVRKKKNT